MPIYEYQCPACGYLFEQLQKVSDEPLKICPKCHADGLTKLVSATSFQLKGNGWYATDFRDKSKPSCQSEKPGGAESTCSCCKDCPAKKES